MLVVCPRVFDKLFDDPLIMNVNCIGKCLETLLKWFRLSMIHDDSIAV